MKGEGNEIDFGARVYDPRIGRFLSVDPLIKDQPSYSSYLFAGNRPINHVDINGAVEGEPVPEEGRPHLRAIMGGLILPMNMAPYTRYGISRAGYEYETNPLSTAEQIRQEEAFRREEYIRNSLMIGGKWVPRSEDEIRDLRFQATMSAVNKFNESLKPPLYGTNISLPTQYIRETRTDRQISGDYYAIPSTIVNGRFQSRGKGMTGEYDIIVTLDGTVKLGRGHYYLSMSAKYVQLAGTVQMYDGKVKSITNLSGHYLPSEEETKNFGKILKRYGVKVSGASLHTYKVENERTVKVGKTKID